MPLQPLLTRIINTALAWSPTVAGALILLIVAAVILEASASNHRP